MCRRISTRRSPRCARPWRIFSIAPHNLESRPPPTISRRRKLSTEFYRRDPQGDIDKIYAQVIRDAPSLKQAQASLEQAQRDLDQAKLDLSYCTVVAEIDGVITRRNVNPGNNVQVGQSLMAIRSLRDIWVDANFKETQLRDLRIGQRVELKVDMYGGKHKFEGRISGFTMGTGSTLALLPPQNATGNFVKVVQRLPVRIDIVDYDPDKLPLFVGLSVEPSVDLKSKPTGPHAGKFLQEVAPARACDESVSTAAAGDRGRDRDRQAARAQSMDRRARRDHPDVHGSARHDDRQCGAALHRRRTFRTVHRQRMGHHQLSRRERHHSSDVGLAFGEAGKTEVLPDLDRGLHSRFSPVRNGDEPRNADRGPRAAGPRRRRVATLEPGGAPRRISAGKARLRDDFIRHRRAACTGRRADARRLHHRQLWLALDLLSSISPSGSSPCGFAARSCTTPTT